MHKQSGLSLALYAHERHGGVSNPCCLCFWMSPDEFVRVSRVLGLNDSKIMVCEGVGARRS